MVAAPSEVAIYNRARSEALVKHPITQIGATKLGLCAFVGSLVALSVFLKFCGISLEYIIVEMMLLSAFCGAIAYLWERPREKRHWSYLIERERELSQQLSKAPS